MIQKQAKVVLESHILKIEIPIWVNANPEIPILDKYVTMLLKKVMTLLHHEKVTVRSNDLNYKHYSNMIKDLLESSMEPRYTFNEVLYLGLTISLSALCVSVTLIWLICTIRQRSKGSDKFDQKVNPQLD